MTVYRTRRGVFTVGTISITPDGVDVPAGQVPAVLAAAVASRVTLIAGGVAGAASNRTGYTPGRGVVSTTPVGNTLQVLYSDGAVDTMPYRSPPPGLQRWLAALANRASAPADILVIGDSITEGAGATLKSRRWVEQLITQLRARYPTPGVAGGEGFVQGLYSSGVTFNNGWAYAGGVSPNGTFGFGHRSLVLAGGGAGSATRTVTGTSIKLEYLKATSTGSFSVFLDGSSSAALTVNTATGATSTAHGGGNATLSLGSRGTHTVKIAWAAGGDVYLNGLWIYDQDENAGIRLTESGQFGSTSTNWSPTANPGTAYTLADDIAVLQPDLVLIELMPNDRTGNIPSATSKTAVSDLIDQVNGACTIDPSILLVGDYLEGGGAEPWQNYLDAQASLAAADTAHRTFYDMTTSFPPASDNTYGLIAADGVHQSDAGHMFYADRLSAFLSAA